MRLLLAGAHAADLPDPAVVQRRLEIVQRADAELRMQLAHGAWADALQAQEIEQRRRELGQQLAVVRRAARLGDFADLLRQVAADARHLAAGRGSSRSASRTAQLATVSEALRYARILKGFSPLISSRSAISRKQARDGEIIHAAGSRG